MSTAPFLSLRSRLLLLVLLAGLPTLALILYSGFEERHHAAADPHEKLPENVGHLH